MSNSIVVNSLKSNIVAADKKITLFSKRAKEAAAEAAALEPNFNAAVAFVDASADETEDREASITQEQAAAFRNLLGSGFAAEGKALKLKLEKLEKNLSEHYSERASLVAEVSRLTGTPAVTVEEDAEAVLAA